jgi:hypothetical protein
MNLLCHTKQICHNIVLLSVKCHNMVLFSVKCHLLASTFHPRERNSRMQENIHTELGPGKRSAITRSITPIKIKKKFGNKSTPKKITKISAEKVKKYVKKFENLQAEISPHAVKTSLKNGLGLSELEKLQRIFNPGGKLCVERKN